MLGRERDYTIPRVPTFKDMEELKESVRADVERAKKDIIESLDSQKKKITDDVRKSMGVQSCGICDDYGHKARDCSKFDTSRFCRVCGDSYHVTKNCPESKRSCGRCGMKNHHNIKIHDITDKTKRSALIKETEGDAFDHFLQVVEKKENSGQELGKPMERGNLGLAGGKKYKNWK